MCAQVCELLNVSIIVYVLILTRTYIRRSIYVLACIVIYLHIIPLSANGKGLDDGRECGKGKMDEGGGNGLLQSDFLFPFDFIVAKVLFWSEYEMSVWLGVLLIDNGDWN